MGQVCCTEDFRTGAEAEVDVTCAASPVSGEYVVVGGAPGPVDPCGDHCVTLASFDTAEDSADASTCAPPSDGSRVPTRTHTPVSGLDVAPAARTGRRRAWARRVAARVGARLGRPRRASAAGSAQPGAIPSPACQPIDEDPPSRQASAEGLVEEPGDKAREGDSAGSGVADDLQWAAVARECRGYLEAGDWLAAERVLLEAHRLCEARGDEAGLRALRALPEYADAVGALRRLDAVMGADRGDAGETEHKWKPGVDMPVDLKSLGLETVTNEPGNCKIFYRVLGKALEVRVKCTVPTRVANGTPVALGWLAMWQETGLWEEWHPVVGKGGPRELVPPSVHRRLWAIPVSTIFRSSTLMQEVGCTADKAAGALVMDMRGCGPNHPAHKDYPAPQGFPLSPMTLNTSWVMRPRSRDTSIEFNLRVEAPFAFPSFLAKWVVAWFLPEVTRGMIRAAATCLSGKGPHAKPIAEDVLGTYAAVEEVVRAGEALGSDAEANAAPRRPLLEPLPEAAGQRPAAGP